MGSDWIATHASEPRITGAKRDALAQNRVPLVQETLGRLFLQLAKAHLAPSPNHFGADFEVSGSRRSGSQLNSSLAIAAAMLWCTQGGTGTTLDFNGVDRASLRKGPFRMIWRSKS